MRLNVFSVLFLRFVVPLAVLAGPADAVVKIGGCSGVCVSEGGLVLSARHCRLDTRETVTFPDGREVPAELVWFTHEPEGPVAYDCEGSGYPWVPVADAVPPPGSAVFTYGYPSAAGRTLRRAAGALTGGGRYRIGANPVEFLANKTDFATGPGWSGGPLLDEEGRVVGLLSAGDASSSVFISWRATRDAFVTAQALLPDQRPNGSSAAGLELVVFTQPGCTACMEFERDWRAGHFGRHRVTFCRYDVLTETWSHPDLRREFEQVLIRKPPTEALGFPTFWIRGTDEYRVGYGRERRGGLVGWIAGVLRHVGEGLFGKPSTPAFPPAPIGSTPVLTPGPSTPKRPPELDAVLADVGALKRTVEQVARDIAEFKDGGLITKLKNVGDLKRDKAELLARVDSLKRDVTAFRDRFRTGPLTMLWGLLGLVTGALHRRFAG